MLGEQHWLTAAGRKSMRKARIFFDKIPSKSGNPWHEKTNTLTTAPKHKEFKHMARYYYIKKNNFKLLLSHTYSHWEK